MTCYLAATAVGRLVAVGARLAAAAVGVPGCAAGARHSTLHAGAPCGCACSGGLARAMSDMILIPRAVPQEH